MTLLLSWLQTTANLMAPLLLCALGGFFCERGGVINIGLEGWMLLGALCGAVLTLQLKSYFLMLLFTFALGLAGGFAYAWLVVKQRRHAILVGTAFNIAMLGLPALVLRPLYGVTGSSPSLPLELHAPHLVLGDFSLSYFLLAALLLAFAASLFVRRTRWGLYFHAAGEHPAALAVAGLSPRGVRLAGTSFGCAVATLSGVFLSTDGGSQFARNMSAGRGFMALAALVMSGWSPRGVILSTFIFAGFDSLQILGSSLVQSAAPGLALPSHLFQALPYLGTLLVLFFYRGKQRAPSALGSSV